MAPISEDDPECLDPSALPRQHAVSPRPFRGPRSSVAFFPSTKLRSVDRFFFVAFDASAPPCPSAPSFIFFFVHTPVQCTMWVSRRAPFGLPLLDGSPFRRPPCLRASLLSLMQLVRLLVSALYYSPLPDISFPADRQSFRLFRLQQPPTVGCRSFLVAHEFFPLEGVRRRSPSLTLPGVRVFLFRVCWNYTVRDTRWRSLFPPLQSLLQCSVVVPPLQRSPHRAPPLAAASRCRYVAERPTPLDRSSLARLDAYGREHFFFPTSIVSSKC